MDDIRDLKLFLLLSKNETLLKENSVEKFLHQAIIDYNCLLGKLIFLKEMKRIINPMGWFKRIIRSKEVIGSFNKLFIFPEIWSVKERKSIRKLGLFHEDLTFLFSQNLIEGPFLEYYNKFYFDGEGEGGVIMRLSKNIIRGLDAKRLYYEVDDEFSKVFIEQIKINDDFKKVLFHSFFQSLIYFWQKIIPKLKFLRFSYNATREYFINKGMQTKVFDKPSDLDFRKQNDCLDVMTLLLSLDESKIPNYLINTRIRDLLQKRSAAVAAANPEQVRVLDKELKINSDPELKKNLRQTFFPKH